MTESDRQNEEKLKKIEARKAAFEKSPFWFTVWDLSSKILEALFWLAFWSLIVQCSCDCVWKA